MNWLATVVAFNVSLIVLGERSPERLMVLVTPVSTWCVFVVVVLIS